MRTSLIEVQEIERYLQNQLPEEERLLFEAKMSLNTALEIKVRTQQESYDQIITYGRNQLKTQINKVHQQLFTRPEYMGFRRKIFALFTRT